MHSQVSIHFSRSISRQKEGKKTNETMWKNENIFISSSPILSIVSPLFFALILLLFHFIVISYNNDFFFPQFCSIACIMHNYMKWFSGLEFSLRFSFACRCIQLYIYTHSMFTVSSCFVLVSDLFVCGWRQLPKPILVFNMNWKVSISESNLNFELKR